LQSLQAGAHPAVTHRHDGYIPRGSLSRAAALFEVAEEEVHWMEGGHASTIWWPGGCAGEADIRQNALVLAALEELRAQD